MTTRASLVVPGKHGIVVEAGRGGGVRVRAVASGGVAALAGVTEGDVIVEVDRMDVSESSLIEVRGCSLFPPRAWIRLVCVSRSRCKCVCVSVSASAHGCTQSSAPVGAGQCGTWPVGADPARRRACAEAPRCWRAPRLASTDCGRDPASARTRGGGDGALFGRNPRRGEGSNHHSNGGTCIHRTHASDPGEHRGGGDNTRGATTSL